MSRLSAGRSPSAGNQVTSHGLDCFFIVRAPRSGTSALAKYPKHRPSIGFSSPKETNYFLTVGPKASPTVVKAQFLKDFFEPAGGQTRIFGEGSASRMTRPLRKGLKRSNSVDVTLPPFDPALRGRLRDYSGDDIVQQSRLLERNLSRWPGRPADERRQRGVRGNGGPSTLTPRPWP
jgi:hypothetical protein